MKTIGRHVAIAIGGYWLFDMLYDDRRKHSRRLADFPCSPWWLDLWCGDEKFPPWLNRIMTLIRRCWYRGKTMTCICPGCSHEIPMWWPTPLCLCCGHEEECCHEHVDDPSPDAPKGGET